MDGQDIEFRPVVVIGLGDCNRHVLFCIVVRTRDSSDLVVEAHVRLEQPPSIWASRQGDLHFCQSAVRKVQEVPHGLILLHVAAQAVSCSL